MPKIKKIIVPVNGQKAEIDFTKLDSDIQNVNTKLSKLKFDIKNGSKSFRSAFIFYSYPTDLNELYEVDLVVPVIGKYDLAVFGRELCEPDSEARPDTIKIISQLNESYGTEVFGYVPIGCLTPEEDPEIDVSNLTIEQIKTRILSWKEMGAKGIFLDEFGYDYRTTRERQNEVVDFCHANSLPVIANAWVTDHIFGTENYIVEAGNTKKHPGNPNNLECHLTEDDYVFFEHLMFYGVSDTKVTAQVPWDVYRVQEYYEKYYKQFKTQVFIANQVPTNASEAVQKELIRCSQIAGAVMQADVLSVAGEFWSSESSKTFYVEPFEIDGVKSRFIDVTYKGNEDTGYPIKFKSVIGSREYELVWNAKNEDDEVYSSTKNYALVNSERDFPLNVSAEKLIYQNYDISATHNFKNGINLNGSKLTGTTDGALKFQDKNIVRSVNNVPADENGNVNVTSVAPVNISLSGAVQGSASFNGTDDITIETTTDLEDTIINNMVGNAKEGQVLSAIFDTTKNQNVVTSHPLIEFCKIVTTTDTLNQLKLVPVGMSTIFSDWYRFSHWRSEQNLSGNTGHVMPGGTYSGVEHAAARSGWTYDKSTNMIKSNRNSPVYAGFINPLKLKQWYLKVQIYGGGDGDNDGILINVAFMKDSNGVEHTIDLVRARSGVGNGVYLDDKKGMEFYWSLVYDYRQDTQKELANNPKVYCAPTNIPQYGWGTNYACMSCQRNVTNIKCYTSDVVSTPITTVNENSLIDYTLPSSKPSDWSDAMWSNMQTLLLNPSQMGVGAHSQNGLFTILEQKYIFNDEKIYDMVNDIIWEYSEKTNNWNNVGKCSASLREGQIYYNESTKQTFYYTNGNVYCIGNGN